MPLILNDEQSMLRDAARDFIGGEAPVAHLRELRDSRDETGFSHDLWKAFAEMGFTGVLAPEDLGGSGLGQMETAVIMEEIGRNLTPSPFLSTAVLGIMFFTTFTRLQTLAPSSPDFEAVAAGTVGLNLIAGIAIALASVAFTALVQGVVAAEVGGRADVGGVEPVFAVGVEVVGGAGEVAGDLVAVVAVGRLAGLLLAEGLLLLVEVALAASAATSSQMRRSSWIAFSGISIVADA